MNRKLTLAFVFIFSASIAFCSTPDSLHAKKVTNHFQLLVGNYATESIIASVNNIYKPYYTAPGQLAYGNNMTESFYAQKLRLTELSAYSLGFNYSIDLSKHVGVGTGINYFTYGAIVYGDYNPRPDCVGPGNSYIQYRRIIYISSLQVPVHLKVYQNCQHGRLVFSLGPDFYFPTNSFGKESTAYDYIPIGGSNAHIHYHISAINFLKGGSSGVSAGFGFEKTLSKKLMIELLPEFSLLNAVPFDFEGQGKDIYQNYIFNTAFGLNTYLTFTK